MPPGPDPHTLDLVVDDVYAPSPGPGIAGEPLNRIFGVGKAGGFRTGAVSRTTRDRRFQNYRVPAPVDARLDCLGDASRA